MANSGCDTRLSSQINWPAWLQHRIIQAVEKNRRGAASACSRNCSLTLPA